MQQKLKKFARFSWRLCRNLVCYFSVGRQWLYPQKKLTDDFGPSDAEYAWYVYLYHLSQLQHQGFKHTQNALEIGPGQNLGTSLLFWSDAYSQIGEVAQITLWDVFENATPSSSGYWSSLAKELIQKAPKDAPSYLIEILRLVGAEDLHPNIHYQVCDFEELQVDNLDLMYSQASLEHVDHVEKVWQLAGKMHDCWQSHRIDLADHGRRHTNYIEMLEWSEWAWRASMCFIPGHINRWRASQYVKCLQKNGFTILHQTRDERDKLPIPRSCISKPFRFFEEQDLRTTGLNLVAINHRTSEACQ